MGTLKGIVTLVLLILFIGIWVWSWQKRRKDVFEKMAALPLEDNNEETRS